MIISDNKSTNRIFSGTEKAAILLLSVDEASAAKVFSMMSEEEIKDISAAMSSLGMVSPEIVDQLINEFTSTISNSTTFVGDAETTEKLLSKVLDKERVRGIMEEIRGPAGKNTWDKLGNVNEEILAGYLKNEYPQTVSLIVSKLSPAQASRILSTLPEELSFEVIMRMLNMEPVKREVLDKVEKTLRSEFITTLTKTQKSETKEAVAEIFNNFDRANEAKFMGLLEEKSPEHAEMIKDMMFTFDDLINVNPTGIQALLRNIDKNKLAIALKGAVEPVKKLFTTNMSQRAAKILMEDIEALGPVRVRDVDEAQSTIVTIAREMAAKGEILLTSASEDEEFIS